MAEDTPQPPARSSADKEKSKQQSRPVTGKGGKPPTPPGSAKSSAGATKGGQAPGGSANTQRSGSSNGAQSAKPAATRPAGQRPKGGSAPQARRPQGKGPPARRPRRSPTSWVTWIVVGVVLIVVIVLVVVKITQPAATSSNVTAGFTPAEASVIQDATTIPTSVYNKVGIDSPTVAVTPPVVITGQPVLMLAGKPGIFYLGGEFCPYCAAQRWVIVTSMSRFGTFANIGNMQSSSSDVFANTPTFTFSKATFQSPYVTFQPVEHYSNVPDPSTGYYKILTPFSKEQAALVKKFSTAQFNSAATGIPFQDVGNKALFAGPSYSPGALSGLTRNEIAANLSDPTNPTTQAILSASNYMSATVCAIDGQQPSSVCTSKGVTEAASALKLSS
jgi:hypothetical protein